MKDTIPARFTHSPSELPPYYLRTGHFPIAGNTIESVNLVQGADLPAIMEALTKFDNEAATDDWIYSPIPFPLPHSKNYIIQICEKTPEPDGSYYIVGYW